MSFRKPCLRTLIVVNTKTHKIVATREENMNGGSNAKITKPLFTLLTDGSHICYYAHRPDDIRVPAEINGRHYVKPKGWTPSQIGCVPGGKAPVINAPTVPTTPKVRKFYNTTGYGDGTAYVEYDGKTFTCVSTSGVRQPNIVWDIKSVESWIRRGTMIER